MHRLVEERARDPQPGTRRGAAVSGGILRPVPHSSHGAHPAHCGRARARPVSRGRRMVRALRRWESPAPSRSAGKIMKRILILGVNGFIGHHLSKRILATTDWDRYGIDT